MFEITNMHTLNFLPYDGEVYYHGGIFTPENSDQYFLTLKNEISWKPDEAIINGQHITTKRHSAWYGDQPFEYTYSKVTKRALPWHPILLNLKTIVQEKSGEIFNSCLLNRYHDGSESMSWHSDAEKDLKMNGAIASLSFGAERKFSFKHIKTKHSISLTLHHGSLLIMKGTTQSHWLHALPPTKTVSGSRINLTFRTIKDKCSSMPIIEQ